MTTARFAAWLERLGDQFWLRPALVVLVCVVAALGAVEIERAGWLGAVSTAGSWSYAGGAEGARGLLSAVASSSIGVAGTVFSITIAALSLASGQMGPRLLRNFIRDGRNQLALGVFVGSFAYALLVLRSVRAPDEGDFVPHAAVSGAILLALVCVGTLVWFVHHVATSINVETVVGSVHEDLVAAVEQGARDAPDPAPVALPGGHRIAVSGHDYLLAIDRESLADWADEAGAAVRLRVRPGDYVPRGFPVAELDRPSSGAREAIARALTFGPQPTPLQDLEYAVRQLSEIAVRALSPGINDPFTAGSVLERFGDALCRLSGRFLPTGVVMRGGRVVLVHPVTDYEGLADAMFHALRQNAGGSAYVLIRLLDVLAKVAEVERQPERLTVLRRHAELAVEAGWAGLATEAARADLARRLSRLDALLPPRSA